MFKKYLNALRRFLHRLIGYKVEIICEKGVSAGDVITSRCWLSSHGTVHAKWCGQTVILCNDHSVRGLPEGWHATWRILN